MTLPKHTEELLEDLAESLQVPPSLYEAAERSYKSVGDWLNRNESCLRQAEPKVYIQGSFQLGTAIRPMSDSEDYDVDLVCEVDLAKSQTTQAGLKLMLGDELKAYASSHGMKSPEEGRRCWTQVYANGAQFHLDTLPAIPDAAYNRLLLEHQGLSSEWTDTAIAITDQEHHSFDSITNDWPHSNPKGYANWFRSRMEAIFEARRRAMALEARADVEDIPKYKIRTPLQSAVQILKQHRDVMFANRSDDKPISIILTTLAAHAYQQEPTISAALYSILDRMNDYIEYRSGVAWIANPTDPAENFADRWKKQPERETAFHEWLDQARKDFGTAARSSNRESAVAALQPRIGRKLLDEATKQRRGSSLTRAFGKTRRLTTMLNPSHRKAPPWTVVDQGEVHIEHAAIKRNGFRLREFPDSTTPLPKHCKLIFQADTNIPRPFKVYWQVVNTGPEAEAANGLRGRFDEGIVTSGKLTKNETTLYSGKHSIECFIVKNGYLAARSGQFVVNIQ